MTAGRQRLRVVAGSEGATGESTPDSPHCTLLYYSDSVLSCAYNQPVMPDDALGSTRLRLNKPPKTIMPRVETPEIEAKKPRSVCKRTIGPFSHFQNILLNLDALGAK